MHPAIKTLLICILIGLVFGTYLYFSYDHRPVRIVISILSSVSIGSLMMLAIYCRHYFIHISRYQAVKMIIMICLLTGAAMIGSEFTLAVRSLMVPGEPYRWLNGGSLYVLNILIALVTGLPIYVSEEFKDILRSRISTQQYRLLQLEQQQTVFELELLRAKINPHFLYNVHNTIAGLIEKDPVKAEEMVLLLSRFFRFSLSKNSATFHSVSDELEVITTYLNMQQIRFEDRMTYNIEVDPLALAIPIPSFILQPVVENAVKHGIENSAASGFIQVKIALVEERMIIVISDSGPAFPDQPGTGSGLQMVMNKLRLLYADDYKITFNNVPEKYIQLTIPGKD